MNFVTSKDSTRIAYDQNGAGPVLIVIAGAMGTRNNFGASNLPDLLASKLTVINYDRRGRGDSTDTLPYAVEREIEDIEALIEALGAQASLVGFSSGACLALLAAAKLGDKVLKVAAYEAPYDSKPEAAVPWRRYTKDVQLAVDERRLADAVELFMRFVGVPDEQIKGMRQGPHWASLEAVAPTLPYDAACIGPNRAVPTAKLAHITAEALVLDGSLSKQYMPFMAESAVQIAHAIPRARRKTIEGQGHDVDMAVLAPVLIDFFTD